MRSAHTRGRRGAGTQLNEESRRPLRLLGRTFRRGPMRRAGARRRRHSSESPGELRKRARSSVASAVSKAPASMARRPASTSKTAARSRESRGLCELGCELAPRPREAGAGVADHVERARAEIAARSGGSRGRAPHPGTVRGGNGTHCHRARSPAVARRCRHGGRRGRCVRRGPSPAGASPSRSGVRVRRRRPGRHGRRSPTRSTRRRT